MWGALNFLDVGLSVIAGQNGAVEVGLIVRLFDDNYSGVMLYKAVMVTAVPAFLTQVKRMHLLRWLNIGMGCICLWNAVVAISSALL